MLAPWAALNTRYPNTTQCTKGADLKWLRLKAKETLAST